jgi:hypothetical protein
MSVINQVREIADLVQKIGDIDLYRKIVDLQAEVVELSTQNFELQKRCKELQEELSRKQNLQHRRSIYYAEGDSIPFCPYCWESDSKLTHLFCVAMTNPELECWECSVCRHSYSAKIGHDFTPRKRKHWER